MSDPADSSPQPVSLQYADQTIKAQSQRGKGFLGLAGNVILPGLGHILSGRYRRGIIWFGAIELLTGMSLAAFWSPRFIPILPVAIPLLIILQVAALIDG